MLTVERQAALFASLAAIDTEGVAVLISWADIADVAHMLEDADIAVTLRLSADVIDSEYTSNTMYAGVVENGPTSMSQKTHQYRRCTLSISMHTRGSADVAASDMVDAYVEQVQLWAMSALRDIVGAVEDLGVQDLSYMSDGAQRRDMSLYLTYEQALTSDVSLVQDIEADVSIS